MKIGQGEFTYEWIEHWARIPETESGKANGRTHGVVNISTMGFGRVVVSSDSRVPSPPARITFHATFRSSAQTA